MRVCDLIDEATKLSTWDALAIEVMGGDEVARALYMHHVEGGSVRAIASTMNISESSLRTKIHRAHAAMRRLGIMRPEWEAPEKNKTISLSE
jgi:predicted RNA polymerase sigma factor